MGGVTGAGAGADAAAGALGGAATTASASGMRERPREYCANLEGGGARAWGEG